MSKKFLLKNGLSAITQFLWELVVAIMKLFFEICRGLLKVILLIVGIRFAPQATGDIILATRQRKQRKRIEALEAEIQKLKQTS